MSIIAPFTFSNLFGPPSIFTIFFVLRIHRVLSGQNAIIMPSKGSTLTLEFVEAARG